MLMVYQEPMIIQWAKVVTVIVTTRTGKYHTIA
jgi:hypothetical protein